MDYGEVLIIGAGGVGTVVTRKVAKVSQVFSEVMLASRNEVEAHAHAPERRLPRRTVRGARRRGAETIGSEHQDRLSRPRLRPLPFRRLESAPGSSQQHQIQDVEHDEEEDEEHQDHADLGFEAAETRHGLHVSFRSGSDRGTSRARGEPFGELGLVIQKDDAWQDQTGGPADPQPGNVPLVCDMSSDLFSRRVDFKSFSMIYAGAQKNLGPAGVTLVVVHERFLEKAATGLPVMLWYKTHADKLSLYNTPPVFAVYMMRLTMEWIKRQGGLSAIEKTNVAKKERIYQMMLDSSIYDDADGKDLGYAHLYPMEAIADILKGILYWRFL